MHERLQPYASTAAALGITVFKHSPRTTPTSTASISTAALSIVAKPTAKIQRY